MKPSAGSEQSVAEAAARLAAHMPDFCCPICKGAVEYIAEPAAWYCRDCGRGYPIVQGIADFRVWPDPYISADDDWAKGARVAAMAGGGFRPMLEAYWRLTPDVPASMAARFIRYALVGAARGRTRVDRVRQIRGTPLGKRDRVLDVGCGAGGLVVAAARPARLVVGVDIAARWLMVARAQLDEAGVDNAVLVCACAEYLPFPDRTFDVVFVNDVLEHCQNQLALLREIGRAVVSDGLLLLSTQNRWSLRGEPHVRLWGVGLLPRRWMPAYVRLARRVPYRFIRLVSLPELRDLLRKAGFSRMRWLLPEFAAEELEGLAAGERRLAGLYQRLQEWTVARPVLRLFGPVLETAACRMLSRSGRDP